MAATAAARRVAATAPRRATANRPALKPRPRRAQQPRRAARPSGRSRARRPRASVAGRRRSQTPIGGFVPVAVGATAGAIGGIADSGLVVRLTRGRLWIGALGTLLVGIVALNVYALSLNASSSHLAQQTDGLQRANSALQARVAGRLSNEKVLAAADQLGLFYPAADTVRALVPGPNDAAIAARRLADGDFTLGSTLAPPAVVPPPAPTSATDPVAPETAPVADEAAAPPASTDPTTAAAPPSAATAPDAGAVAAP